ncbi:MAG TPA: hypothetical protein VFK05_24060 [Polyangiaceae bacterium]|nr:hypothetical protein [Polyangiaceae bacterium]
MVGSGFGGWCARGVCFGLVLSFASKSLAQSSASFPAPPTPGSAPTAKPTPAPTPAPPPAVKPAPPPPAASPSAVEPAPPTPKAAPLPNAQDANPALPPSSAPSPFTPGFYPALLPYRSGLPIPPGYRVEDRAATGMIGGGLATLLVGYGTAIVLGASASFKDGTGWLTLPVIGPWAAIGARSYHCTNDPQLANQCISGAFSEVQTIAILSADAVVQATGAVLLVAGLASGHDELVRTDLPASVRISPRALGVNGFGIGVDGRF